MIDMIYTVYEFYTVFLWAVFALSAFFLVMSGLKFVLWPNDINEEES